MKVRSLDLCASGISHDVCHKQYRFGLCSRLRVARMFFVLYVNEMIGLVGFRMRLVSRESGRCSEAKTVISILPSREGREAGSGANDSGW